MRQASNQSETFSWGNTFRSLISLAGIKNVKVKVRAKVEFQKANVSEIMHIQIQTQILKVQKELLILEFVLKSVRSLLSIILLFAQFSAFCHFVCQRYLESHEHQCYDFFCTLRCFQKYCEALTSVLQKCGDARSIIAKYQRAILESSSQSSELLFSFEAQFRESLQTVQTQLSVITTTKVLLPQKKQQQCVVVVFAVKRLKRERDQKIIRRIPIMLLTSVHFGQTSILIQIWLEEGKIS